jgi:hypothetical protein
VAYILGGVARDVKWEGEGAKNLPRKNKKEAKPAARLFPLPPSHRAAKSV